MWVYATIRLHLRQTQYMRGGTPWKELAIRMQRKSALLLMAEEEMEAETDCGRLNYRHLLIKQTLKLRYLTFLRELQNGTR